MDSFEKLADQLANHPTAAMLACALIAIAYLYRDGRRRDEAHLQTAMQIAPLASKLVTCVEILERLTPWMGPRAAPMPPAPPPPAPNQEA